MVGEHSAQNKLKNPATVPEGPPPADDALCVAVLLSVLLPE